MREWLIALRNEQKLSAEEVAKQLNISPSYYSMIEHCKRQKKMDITLVTKLSQLFGVSLDTIIKHESSIPDELFSDKEAG